MVSDLHPFSLNFRGERASLEKEYRNDNIRRSLNRIRSALILVTFLYGFFGFLDNRMSPEEKEIMWMIRFLIVVPCALIVLYLTYRPLFLKYSQPLLLALCLIGALGIIAMSAFSTSSASYSYYAGLILIIITIHTYLQMRFLWAGSCTLLIVLAYEVITAVYIKPPRLIFYNNQFFFLSSALICLAAGYINEVNVRIRYLSEYLLKKEKEKVLGQKQKMEILGTISSGIAHDFNNMLTALQGYTELSLNETDSDSPVHAYQEEVLGVARRAQAMTREILAFSRDDPPSLEPVNIALLFDEIRSYLDPLMNPSLHLTIDLRTSGAITADRQQIHRVLMNLITNAIHAMEERGGDLVLSAWENPGGSVTLAVKDTGPEIGDKERERIFEPYFTTKKDGEGTGLGLFIVKQLVNRYKGEISLESEKGKGAEFRITFPPAP